MSQKFLLAVFLLLFIGFSISKGNDQSGFPSSETLLTFTPGFSKNDTVDFLEFNNETKLKPIDALLMKAASYKDKNEFQHSIQTYNKALSYAIEEQDLLRASTVHYSLGTIYFAIKNYTMAIAEFEACLALKEKVYRPEFFARAAFHLGAIYSEFKNYALALNYYQQALEQFKDLNRHNVIGEVLDSISEVYLAQGSTQEAVDNFLVALKYKREVNNNKEVAALLMKIGGLYLDLKEDDLSLKYLKEALQYSAISNDTLNLARIYGNIGEAYYNKGAFIEAEQNFERAKLEATKAGNKIALADAYKNLANTNEKLSKRSLEVQYFRKYIALKDSLLSEENKKRIDEIKAEFDVQNKQKAIEILEHQKALLSSQAEMKDMAYRSNRILLIFFASVLILIIALLMLLIHRHSAKKKTNLSLQNHLAEVRQQKNQIEAQRDVIEKNHNKLEQARKTIIQKNKLLQENNAFLERTINERTLELYKAYQKLSFHVDNTSLAVMEFNDRLELIRWSDQAEKIFGWKAVEVMGKRFHEIGFVLEKDIDGTIKMMHDLLYGENPRIYFQAVNCNKQHDIIHIEWNTSVLLNQDGSVDSIMAIANDVTSREQAFVKLQSSHRELDNFIYKASHDLRGPLARIQGIVNLGLMEAKEKISREYFNMLQLTGAQLNNILSRLLMTYDINHHRIRLEKVAIKEEVEEMLEALYKENSHFNIRFDLKINENTAWKTDVVLFRIVIRNMFDNALFFRDKKEIKVKIEVEQIYNEKLLIKITDNGLGIPESVRDRVFDMFFHGAARSGGTGLGLYMAKKAVERLGGIIQLTNAEARNTVFKIILPTLFLKTISAEQFEENKLSLN